MNHGITGELPLEGKNRIVVIAMAIIVSAHILAIALAETTGALVGAFPGVLLHAILIPALLVNYVLVSGSPYARIYPLLALAPLLRILSLVMPVNQAPQIYWYAMVGVPLLLAVALCARLLDLVRSSLGLHLRSWPLQIIVGGSGVPLGIIAYLILKPEPVIAIPTWHNLLIGAIILTVFTGLTEELIFRGMLQHVAYALFGRTGILFSTALFAVMYIGSLSLTYVLFMGLVGLYFSWCVHRTGSIWGVVTAHSTLNIGALLIWPVLIAAIPPWVIYGMSLLPALAVGALLWNAWSDKGLHDDLRNDTPSTS